jgi:hypothetical protein|tara:strand:- start:106 stop:657 length:552 start_codon:yes stop_codon:yes gene_type:complete
MTKLCARGKSAAKRKFKVYPSAYANAYASKICAGKIKDPSGTKRKDWGPKKAKVGMAVTAGSQSAMGRLEKSGMTKAKKGKLMIMIAIGKPKKAKEGLSVRPYDPRDKKQKKITDKQNPISEYDPKTKKLKYTAANKGTIMKVANKLEKASKAHAGQAKTLKSLKLSRGGGAAIRGTNFQGVF